MLQDTLPIWGPGADPRYGLGMESRREIAESQVGLFLSIGIARLTDDPSGDRRSDNINNVICMKLYRRFILPTY